MLMNVAQKYLNGQNYGCIVTFSVGYTVFWQPAHLSLVPPNILETLVAAGFWLKTAQK